MVKKEWLAPGIVIAALTIGGNFVSDWAVRRYRGDQVETAIHELRAEVKRQNDATNMRIDKIDIQLRDMSKSALDTAHIQEKLDAQDRRLGEMRADMKDADGREQARYDSLSTRLARIGN